MGHSDNQIPIVLSVLALVLAVIGVIIAGVSLSQKGTNNYNIGDPGTSSGSSSALSGRGVLDDNNKIWLIAVGDTASSEEYIDEISGEIEGFNIDIVNAVCKIAGKNCRLVVDVFNRCWDSEPGQSQRGGTGLFQGYYDACTAWHNTYIRARTFQFSDPFAIAAREAGFVVKPGNPRGFDYQDITDKKIGFIDGFFYDEFCIARQGLQGVPIPEELITHYTTRDDLLTGIQNEEVDAGFDSRFVWAKTDLLDVVPGFTAECSIAGRSMMMRKDNNFWQWWNPAFASLRSSTEYKLICKDLEEQHGHLPGPSPEELCFDYK